MFNLVYNRLNLCFSICTPIFYTYKQGYKAINDFKFMNSYDEEYFRKKFPVWMKILDEIPIILVVIIATSVTNYFYNSFVTPDKTLVIPLHLHLFYLVLSICIAFIFIMVIYSTWVYLVKFREIYKSRKK